jgi:Ca2+-transporting ATPase
MIVWSVFQGGLSFALLAVVFALESRSGMPEAELRALIFFALTAHIMALILVNRSFSASLGKAFKRRNRALAYVALAILAVTALILWLPWAQVLLKFGTIAWADMTFAAGLGIVVLLLEACKPIF